MDTPTPELYSQSSKRLSEYVSRLFGEGELFDVIAITQQELQNNPSNLDMMVYRACACLVLQVSGTITLDYEIIEQAIDQLNLIAELMSERASYDDSLNFYIALGYLALGKFDLADRTLETLHLSPSDDADALEYYHGRKKFWEERGDPPLHPSSSFGPS